MVKKRLFGTAGIRGPYLEKISPDLVFKLGLAIATYVGGSGGSCIGYDVRTTSPLLAASLASGLMAGGLNVYNLELTPTPVLAYSVPHTRSKVGIVITASHNPPEDNGLKCFDGSGMEYTEDLEVIIEDLVFNERFKYASWDKVGKPYIRTDIVDDYIEDLTSKLEPKKVSKSIKVVIDAANGSAYNVTPRILRMLGAKVITVNANPDGFFPGRIPEPRPDVLKELGVMCKGLNLDCIFAHDGDADRLSVLDEKGSFILNDTLIAFYAKTKLLEKGRGIVVISVDVSQAVEEIVERYGGKVVRAKLGKTHEKIKELGKSVIMTAEPWKLIDPDWGLWVDGIYQAALLTKYMIEEGKSISELLLDVPRYPQERFSIDVREDVKEKAVEMIYDEVMTKFRAYREIVEIDGLKVIMDDNSWVLVRPSGTEPKIRFYIEARDVKKLNNYKNELLKITQKILEELER